MKSIRKHLHSWSVLLVALLGLAGCSESHTSIDGESDDRFLESVLHIQETVPAEKTVIFERGLAILKRDPDYLESMDGMNVEDVMKAEFDRLRGILATRVEKREKFQKLADGFRADSMEVPENIAKTLAEVVEEIAEVEAQLALDQ